MYMNIDGGGGRRWGQFMDLVTFVRAVVWRAVSAAAGGAAFGVDLVRDPGELTRAVGRAHNGGRRRQSWLFVDGPPPLGGGGAVVGDVDISEGTGAALVCARDEVE